MYIRIHENNFVSLYYQKGRNTSLCNQLKPLNLWAINLFIFWTFVLAV